MDCIKGKCGTVCNVCQFKEQFNCGGCDKQEGKIFWGECDIYKCAREKGYKHCGECEKLPCAELTQFIENGHNPDRMNNLIQWKNEETKGKCGRNIEIRRLTPDLAEEYVHFFDVTPHDVKIDENKCYCVTWRSDASYENAGHWFPTREERKAKAVEFVRNGFLQGYLAYCDGKIVGWCNANADCRLCVDYLRSFYPIEEYTAGIKVKSVFCFVIAPEMQRMGIATQLLEAVVKDAAAEGFDFVEGYCNSKWENASDDFRGHLAMFEKCGFVKCGERDGKIVVRKALE